MELALIFLGIFSSSFFIALSGALMPGPLLTYTVAESARRGFWAGPIIMLGHGFLELGLVVLLLLGIGIIINQPVIMGIVGLTGAVILWWLGYGLMQAARNAQLDLSGGEGRAIHPFWAGIFMSLANPYWLIWWVTLGLGYVLFAYKYGLWGVLFFFVGHFMADLVWYSLVSLAVAQGKKFISDRLYHNFMVVCAVFLIVFGCYFGYQGIKTLMGA
jgi:threonine/homoserine/homoserine lactone efflux protein